jgi:hypothetical protein
MSAYLVRIGPIDARFISGQTLGVDGGMFLRA